jgi:hypothetical protein
MLQDQNTSATSSVLITPPSLPKGGGTLTGMGETLGQSGPGGVASLSLPLPISASRGFAPGIGLAYSSAAGNGKFGMGWSAGVMSIARRTNHGVPQYNGQDEFLGPDGEVLVKVSEGTNPTTHHQYGNTTLAQTWTVTHYQPRIEGGFNRLEHWQGSAVTDSFWLLHDTAGNLHMLGKTASARVSDPQNHAHIAEWLLEESVSPTGEHIYYCWQGEDATGISDSDRTNKRDCSAQRYLTKVQYGNQTPASDLYLWNSTTPSAKWLFTMVFDYGERTLEPATKPTFNTTSHWLARQDPFSRYEYGFEIRTHRLCRQVLMFHHFPAELGEADTLVSRLLLEYRETPVLSLMTAAQTLAWEKDGSVLSRPPLELEYSEAETAGIAWQQMTSLAGLDAPPYQLVDLYGEGLPGVLCRTGNDWRYRAPCRASSGGDNVAYADWVNLPQIPSLSNATARLMDIDGDGQLDWVVAAPGMAGFFTQRQDKQWSSFTPFSALPEEFFHPKAQFTQLMGSGLVDLAMIGPKSVRLYANEGSAFTAGLNVTQEDGITLPIPGRDARELVLFADILGSGQAHLCRIRHNNITCWPNLGSGRFGQPVTFPLDSMLDDAVLFNPENLLLADTDGSGAPDLIYLQHDRAQVWINQCGNGFIKGPDIVWPAGVFYDRLSQVTIADVQGNGMAELVLTVPYGTAPAHWHIPFSEEKPWLLAGVNNNAGAIHTLHYRSSAQEWLDEKQRNPEATPTLPFAMHLLVKSTSLDEITGNQLAQITRYRQGVYDGQQREFRGFGYVETEDTSDDAKPVGDDTPIAATLLTKAWFHCGREGDEHTLYGSPWQGDKGEVTLKATLLTQWKNDKDVTLSNASDTTRRWMFRALKGSPLRSEAYGLDGSRLESVPYVTTSQRMQVRLVQDGEMPVVMPLALESISHNYERLSSDPQVSQQVTMKVDRYGCVTQQVDAAYPRRAKHVLSPYPANLPDDAWDNTYDEQQQKLRLTESLASFIHLDGAQAWRPGLPNQNRVNHLVFDTLPGDGISYETLSKSSGLLAAPQTRYLGAQNEIFYLTTPPDLRALVSHQRTAVLDEIALQAYEGITIPDDCSFDKLGYVSVPALFSYKTEAPLWAAEHDFVTYNSESQFSTVASQQSSRLVGGVTCQYDQWLTAIISQTDVLNNVVRMEYDYRFLLPWRTIDINDNTQEMQLDALGQAHAGSVYGTENGGQAVGFALVSDYPVPASMTVEQAISLATTPGYLQQLATINVTDWFSWMGQVTSVQANNTQSGGWSTLLNNRYVTFTGHIRPAGRRWASANPQHPLAALLNSADRNPVHSVVLTADNYPDTPDPDQPGKPLQQTGIAISYSDGFGRALQQCVLFPDGKAWHRKSNGEISTDEVDASPRWAISGRTEYDNKGQVVRSYQPWFLDDWHYVVDSAMRSHGYSDTLYYDAPGRNIRTVTAKGYLRRNTLYPWFSVAEDENDTLGLEDIVL